MQTSPQNSGHGHTLASAPGVVQGTTKSRFWSRTWFLRKPVVAWNLLKSTVSESLQDNIQRMSAALAYYTIFSLAPLLVIAISIAGLVFGQEAARGQILGELRQLIGVDSAQAVQGMIASAHKPVHSVLASIIGGLTLLIGATGAFSEVYDALNNIWGAREDTGGGAWTLIRARFLSFELILVVGFLLTVSLVVSAALSGIAKYANEFLPIPAAVLQTVDIVFSVVVITVLFALIFKVLPELHIAWGDVWVGAALTAILFTLGKSLIGFVIGKSIAASSYGAAGSLIIVVAWIYYSALILYFGAEFTQVYACAYGSRTGQPQKRKLHPQTKVAS
jgi:membrane protein